MNQLIPFLTWFGGLALFLPTFAEQIGIPVPAAPILLAGGALAADGRLCLVSAIAWTVAACLVADLIWFYVGCRSKTRVEILMERWHRRRLSRPGTVGARAIIHGMKVLTAAKFLPFGTVVPLRAGTLNITTRRFLFVDLPGSLIYAATYLLLGFYFHQQLNRVIAIIQELGVAGLVLVLGSCVVYTACSYIRRRRADRRASSVSPLTESISTIQFPTEKENLP
ncbi:MAG TPA: DedA family protein [Alphaproteobacteria bacterium]|nr:DedA family protein [Alphaproteobacteria bacterium]